MAKVDKMLRKSLEGNERYKEYVRLTEATDIAAKKLDFPIARGVSVSFRAAHGDLRVFVGPTEFTRKEATTLAEGLLDRLGDYEDTGDTPEEATAGGEEAGDDAVTRS